MKKPNITPGEWEYSHNGHYAEVGHDMSSHKFISIFEIDSEYIVITKEMSIANATAISSVPDMIDALITAHAHVLEVCNHNERLNNGTPSILDRGDLKQIEQALIKAGVQL